MMSKKNIVIFIVCLAFSFALSSQNVFGKDEPEKGIIGTGIKTSQEKGIIGTGIKLASNDIKIIGTITDMGSIFVNGYEVFYDENQKINIYDKQESAEKLEIGQVVEVNAKNNNGKIKAKEISVEHEVIGNVESISKEDNSFEILGQRVEYDPNQIDVEKIYLGKKLAVSGLRDDKDNIIASSISTPPKEVEPRTYATIKQIKENQLFVGNKSFQIPRKYYKHKFRKGQRIAIRGDWKNNKFNIRKLQKIKRKHKHNKNMFVSIEGFPNQERIKDYKLSNIRGIKHKQRMVVEGLYDHKHKILKGRIKAKLKRFRALNKHKVPKRRHNRHLNRRKQGLRNKLKKFYKKRYEKKQNFNK